MAEAVRCGSAPVDSGRRPAVDVLREPCRSPAAWLAADLVDPAAWTVELAPSHLEELESALRETRKYGIVLLKITRDRFRLPTLGRVLERVARGLEHGPGFAVIKGVPVERYDEAEISTIFWGMAQYLGFPVSQDSFGRKLGRLPSAAASRGGRSAADVELRTGGSDVTALLGPRLGGQSSVVSSAALYNEVLRRNPMLVERMYGRFGFDRGGEQLPGEPPYRSLPLVRWYDGKLSFRYRRGDIESAQRFPGVRRLGHADRQLLDLIDGLAAAAEFRFSFGVDPGDIQLFNNYAVLHSHVQQRCHAVSDAGDHALQLWLTLHDGRSLPPDFTWRTPGYGGPHGRGGVAPRDVVDEQRLRA
ncbi:TauD/TfdA family dioxygenase [Saccharopolyspora sp. NPDC002686]|uniref:TauD/TfdA family dioxygenase n=1 Tax=Saccharopolyspora sp. NPDC002686 TaxID=3154541 RepID=UPI00331E33B5